MFPWVIALAALMIGGCGGFGLAALLVAARDSDRHNDPECQCE